MDVQDLIGYRYEDKRECPREFSFLIRPVRMGCGYEAPGFQIVRGRDYPYFTLHVLISGCSFLNIEGQEFLLKKNDAFLILAGEEHTYYNMEKTQVGYLWIELDCTGCPELMHWFKTNRSHMLDSAHTEHLGRHLAEILRFVKTTNETDLFAASGLCYTLIMLLYEAFGALVVRQLPNVVNGALYYIHSHLTENPSVAGIASYLHVSESSLTKQFTTHVGTSPAKYMLLKKIEYAVSLLRNTDLSCESVAEQSGFCDASHMNKAFRKCLGVFPSAMRSVGGGCTRGGANGSCL